ncbi:MAG: hypothetical protein KDE27_05445 [Planctomycetes bacterium]|nr:hypothetical protein [Planctomycetota bacterium]
MAPTAVLEIHPITVAEVRLVASAMLADHYREVSLDQDVPLEPDWLRFEALEVAGNLIALGAYVDGELVGYTANIVTRHLHYPLLMCSNDVFYLAPGHRSFRNARKLIEATEVAAKSQGCDVVAMHAKCSSALEAILEHNPAWRVQDIIYTRRI